MGMKITNRSRAQANGVGENPLNRNGRYLNEVMIQSYLYGNIQQFINNALSVARLVENNVGIGLIDYMVKTQIDVETGEIFPDFGIENDLENYYKKFHTNNTEDDAIYIIKANAQLNTEAHVALQVALQSGKIKFLLEEKVAKEKLLLTKVGQAMTPEERKMYLRPFLLTNVLKEELLNLRQVTESNIHITLRQINNKIGKDKVSSLEYGLYYIKLEEEKKKKRKKFKASDWNFFT